MHAANVGIKTEKLESMRISIAKSSPMWETLDICISVVDTEALDLLVPRLAQLVRSGVGLNTRYMVDSFPTLVILFLKDFFYDFHRLRKFYSYYWSGHYLVVSLLFSLNELSSYNIVMRTVSLNKNSVCLGSIYILG